MKLTHDLLIRDIGLAAPRSGVVGGNPRAVITLFRLPVVEDTGRSQRRLGREIDFSMLGARLGRESIEPVAQSRQVVRMTWRPVSS